MEFDTETGKSDREAVVQPKTSKRRKVGMLPPPPEQYSAEANMYTGAPPLPLPPRRHFLPQKEPDAGGSSSCPMDHSDAYQSLITKYKALREERDNLLNLFGNFDNIAEDLVTPTFKTMFRIGKKDIDVDDPRPSDLQSAADHDDPGFGESLSQGAGGGTTDKDEDLNHPIEQITVKQIRAANSAMIDRILDGPEEKFNFEGIKEIPPELSKLQHLLGNIITQSEKELLHPVVEFDGRRRDDGIFVGKYQIVPELADSAYTPVKIYNNVTEIPIVFVCCVYDFKGERPAHLFAIILFRGKIYSFGFGYKDSDWGKGLETIPLVIYNPDDVMDEPCYTGSGDPKDFRKVAVLNMFLLKREHIERLKAFVVDKNPGVRVVTHKYVSVLQELRVSGSGISVKCIYVASTSEDNNLLLYEGANPGLAYNCAKGLSKIFPEMYCWGNSLATTIRRQALTDENIKGLSKLEEDYYNTLTEWKTGSTTREATESELYLLKSEMDFIKNQAKKLMNPHTFEWGSETLDAFYSLYAAQGPSPKEIADAVLNFLFQIQTIQTSGLEAGPAQAPAAQEKMGTGGTKKRKTHKKRTRSKRSKSKHHKSKSSKKRTKKRKNTI